MPANLPPQYFEAEKRYRLAETPEDKLEALEEMLAIMPKHKGTDKLRAELRAKMAKLRKEAERKAAGRRGGIYTVKKEGAGQAVLLGLPNVGKSLFFRTLTGAPSEVADYPFTTRNPILGMAQIEDIQVQVVDMPPILDDEARPWFANLLRSTDALLVVLDLVDEPAYQVEIIFQELERFRISPMGREEKIERRDLQKRTLLIGNKKDLEGADEGLEQLRNSYARFPLLPVSSRDGDGLEEVKGELFNALDIIRVYTKAPGEKPDFSEPLVLRKGTTVEEAAEELHKEFRHRLKYALVWGSGKFGGQRVARDHILQDRDVIEFHV